MHVITNNPRVSVSHDELRAKFRLHIAGATLEDAGPYMCQINSMPVVKQVSISVFLPLYSFTWNASNAFSFVYKHITQLAEVERLRREIPRKCWKWPPTPPHTVGPCAVHNTNCGSLCSPKHTLWVLVQSTTHTVDPCAVHNTHCGSLCSPESNSVDLYKGQIWVFQQVVNDICGFCSGQLNSGNYQEV